MQTRMKNVGSKLRLLGAVGVFLFSGSLAYADEAIGLNGDEIQQVVEKALDRFKTPGMAVGVIHKGEVVYLEGYGVRDIAREDKVDADTLFSIASTTKAFTAAALAILVDEGKLDWDDRVIDFLPDFRMADPWVTREFTVRDLLTHRSGLGSGAGDLMLWPEPAGFSRAEIMRGLRYLRPVSSFRSEYAYDNLLYIVAGEVIGAASDSTWEVFVQTRILAPLGMNCFSDVIPQASLDNVATPHGYFDGSIAPIPRNAIKGEVKPSAAAGGMACNVRGMVKWMATQLGGGKGPKGTRIFSEEQRDEMWRSQTILNVSATERERDRTHFKTYALAWRKADVLGYEVISHTGTLSGMQAFLTLVPELELGIIVLNNGSNYGARSSVTQAIMKSYMGAEPLDWVDYYHERQLKAAEERASAQTEKQAQQEKGQMSKPLESYLGQYRDPWYGAIEISQTADGLRLTSEKSVQMKGKLEPLAGNTFIVRWDNRKLEADAYVHFETDAAGRIKAITMLAVSEDTDSSFDFPDLRFVPVK